MRVFVLTLSLLIGLSACQTAVPDPVITVEINPEPTSDLTLTPASIESEISELEPMIWPTRPTVVDPNSLAPIIPPTRDDTLPIILGDGMSVALPLEGAQAVQLALPASGESILFVNPDSRLDPLIRLGGETIDERGLGEPEILFLSADGTNLTLEIDRFETSSGTADVTLINPESPQLQPIVDLADTVAFGDLNRHPAELAANGFTLITLTPAEGSDVILELYDSAGIVTSVDDNGIGEAETLFYTPDDADTYVIAVYGFQFAAADYSLTVRQISP